MYIHLLPNKKVFALQSRAKTFHRADTEFIWKWSSPRQEIKPQGVGTPAVSGEGWVVLNTHSVVLRLAQK
jgi:hypothetical protein